MVSDTDGSAFITKAEFDSLKNNFQAQVDNYNSSIDSKIDGAIAAYLSGLQIQDKTFKPPLFDAMEFEEPYDVSIWNKNGKLSLTVGYNSTMDKPYSRALSFIFPWEMFNSYFGINAHKPHNLHIKGGSTTSPHWTCTTAAEYQSHANWLDEIRGFAFSCNDRYASRKVLDGLYVYTTGFYSGYTILEARLPTIGGGIYTEQRLASDPGAHIVAFSSMQDGQIAPGFLFNKNDDGFKSGVKVLWDTSVDGNPVLYTILACANGFNKTSTPWILSNPFLLTFKNEKAIWDGRDTIYTRAQQHLYNPIVLNDTIQSAFQSEKWQRYRIKDLKKLWSYGTNPLGTCNIAIYDQNNMLDLKANVVDHSGDASYRANYYYDSTDVAGYTYQISNATYRNLSGDSTDFYISTPEYVPNSLWSIDQFIAYPFKDNTELNYKVYSGFPIVQAPSGYKKAKFELKSNQPSTNVYFKLSEFNNINDLSDLANVKVDGVAETTTPTITSTGTVIEIDVHGSDYIFVKPVGECKLSVVGDIEFST